VEKVTVQVGSIETGNSGQTNDSRREVCFEAEELATRKEYGEGRDGRITDSRGTTETLYKCADGRLVVHVNEWSHWQGEPDTSWLREVTTDDLSVNGEFEALGRDAGMGRALTLDEALSPSEDEAAA
jgi:hypothetical protein